MANGGDKALSASWLGSRLGIGPTRVDVLRRAGELFGYREPGAQEYRYPAWQFGKDWTIRPIVPRMIAAARARGLREERLYEVLEMRLGMGDERVVDLVRAGDEEGVLRAISSAGGERSG